MSEIQTLGLRYQETCDYLERAVIMTLSYSNEETPNGRLCDMSLANALTMLLAEPQMWSHPPTNTTTAPHRSNRYSPSFGNAVIQFTMSATDAKLRKFRQRLSSCCCSLYKPSSNDHSDRFKTLQRDLHVGNRSGDFIESLANVLYLIVGAVLNTPGIAYPFDPTEKPGEKYSTPTNVSKGIRYMTNKAADAVTASRCWFKHGACAFIPCFLLSCLRRYRDAFLPALRTTGGLDFLSLVTKEVGSLVLAMQRKILPIEEILLTKVSLYLFYMREIVIYLRNPLINTSRPLLDLMHSIVVTLLRVIEPLPPPKMDLVVQRHIDSAIGFIGLATIPDGDDDQMKRGKLMYYFMRNDDFGRKIAMSATTVFDNRDQGEGIYCKIFYDMQLLVPIQECLNPHCGKLPDQHRFPKCARCGRASYCSSQCQKKAWALPECPHKQVCKQWARLGICWSNALEFVVDGLDRAEQNKRLKKSAEHLNISGSTMKEMIENVKKLHAMRLKRARDNNEVDRSGDRMLMDDSEKAPRYMYSF